MSCPTEAEVQLLEVEFRGPEESTIVLLDCAQVLEVIEEQPFRHLPNVAAPFVGVLTLRSTPVPVLDLGEIVRGDRDGESGAERFVICRADAGVVALRVRARLRVRTTTAEHLDAVPDAMAVHAGQIACRRLMRGVDDRYVPIIDVNAIVERVHAAAA